MALLHLALDCFHSSFCYGVELAFCCLSDPKIAVQPSPGQSCFAGGSSACSLSPAQDASPAGLVTADLGAASTWHAIAGKGKITSFPLRIAMSGTSTQLLYTFLVIKR